MKKPNPSSGWREQFNKKFRNTSWYPDNWKPIENFIQSTLSQLISDVREEVIGDDFEYIQFGNKTIESRENAINEAINAEKEEQRSKLKKLEKKYVNHLVGK